MADFASRRTIMVDTQVRPSDVTKYPVIDAMLAVPREDFVPDSRRAVAYSGENLSLGKNRVMFEPRTLAKLIDGLDLQLTDLVLDIGCGYGYATAVIARMTEAVVALEEDESMATEAEARLAAARVDNAAVVQGPLADGFAGQGPYDVILINGAVEAVPATLEDQLKEGGRIGALFMEGNLGVARIGVKINNRVNWRYAFNAHAPMLPGFERSRGFAL